MSEKSRLQSFEELVAQSPDQAFVRYALAMEYRSAGRHDDALREFQTLTERNPDYVATYLMYGQLLNQLDRIEEARKVLERGMSVAQRVGNAHAFGELQELHGSLS